MCQPSQIVVLGIVQSYDTDAPDQAICVGRIRLLAALVKNYDQADGDLW